MLSAVWRNVVIGGTGDERVLLLAALSLVLLVTVGEGVVVVIVFSVTMFLALLCSFLL
jgi:hypothetical protein